tara:strand:+ start:6339 stop:7256 length:918 start_codon:yes stop_codon:yes gene_type:complete
MRVIIKNCDEFYNTFKYVETLASEVKVMCDGEKVWLQVHNPSCTAIAEVKFPADYFEDYDCEHPVTVGIHTKTFLSILKNTYKKKNVTLKMQASDAVDYMLITVTQEDEVNGNVECAYQMKLVDIVSDVMNIPPQDVHSQYKLTVNTLKKWKEFLFANCPITFRPTDSGLVITCEDDMKHKLKLNDEITPSKWNEEMVDDVQRRKWNDISIGEANSNLIFALLSFGKDVRIQFFLEEAPVECYVKLNQGVLIRVFIAPKIRDEDSPPPTPVEEPAPVRTQKRKTMDEQNDEIEQLTQRKKAMTAH